MFTLDQGGALGAVVRRVPAAVRADAGRSRAPDPRLRRWPGGLQRRGHAPRRARRLVRSALCLQPRRDRGADRGDLRQRSSSRRAATPTSSSGGTASRRSTSSARSGCGRCASSWRTTTRARRRAATSTPALPVAAVRGRQLRPGALLAPAVPLQRAVRRGVPPRVDPRDVPRRRRGPHLPAARAGRLALAVRRGLRRAKRARPARRRRSSGWPTSSSAAGTRCCGCAGAQPPLERGNGASAVLRQSRRSSRPPTRTASASRASTTRTSRSPRGCCRRAMRPHVAAVYAFARAADDFADEGTLAPAERYRAARRLEGAAARAGARRRVEHRSVPTASSPPSPQTRRLCELDIQLFDDLLSAFRQDVETRRYAEWAGGPRLLPPIGEPGRTPRPRHRRPSRPRRRAGIGRPVHGAAAGQLLAGLRRRLPPRPDSTCPPKSAAAGGPRKAISPRASGPRPGARPSTRPCGGRASSSTRAGPVADLVTRPAALRAAPDMAGRHADPRPRGGAGPRPARVPPDAGRRRRARGLLWRAIRWRGR